MWMAGRSEDSFITSGSSKRLNNVTRRRPVRRCAIICSKFVRTRNAPQPVKSRWLRSQVLSAGRAEADGQSWFYRSGSNGQPDGEPVARKGAHRNRLQPDSCEGAMAD